MVKPRPSGFTLVEVLVAMAVVALALPALLITLSQHIDGTAYLRDKSLAQMVAANQLAEMRLVSASERQLFRGEDSGEATMAEREFYWWMRSTVTEVEDFYRIEISVALDEGDEEEPLYELVAFLSTNIEEDPIAQPEADAGGEGGDAIDDESVREEAVENSVEAEDDDG
ncbi:MAG: type II secretion system minor pseudopilin GspI [Pseudomonadota bacterium]